MVSDCADRDRQANPPLSRKRKTKAKSVRRISRLTAGGDQRPLGLDPLSQDVNLGAHQAP